MHAWVTSLLFSVLVVTVPFVFFLKILNQLPRPLAQSHRRWPLPLNYALIAAVTSYTTWFIHRGYYSAHRPPLEIAAGCLIAAIVYGFALALLQRQFCGVYPEFIVTAGPFGLGMRKTRYRNIEDVATAAERSGETELRVETAQGRILTLTLPKRYVSIFFGQIQKKLHDG